ncbi:MAG: helix-turn-helix domain-containing protein [Ktedonobacteraceae bacterium]|nr:helix-turn-helix domain-containing protein [Ktedonobacteraceae bacterium]
MDGILEAYDVETIEQVRAMADELRVRIIKQLVLQAMTVTQLADVFGEAPNKLHYHVRELERVGLLKKVETRERGGILEKYYRAVARDINIPKTLLLGMAPDEAAAMLNEVIQPFFQGITRAAGQMMSLSPEAQSEYVFQFAPDHYWMTAEEFGQVSKQMSTLLQPYERPRGIDREHEQTVLHMAYTTLFAGTEQGIAEAATPADLTSSLSATSSSKPPKRRLIIVVGTANFTRYDLESFLAQGEIRTIYILGNCTFADDILPELVERVVASFHIKGRLNASLTVREVLNRKGGEAGKKHGYN